MFIGIFLFFVVVGMTILVGRREGAPDDVPFAETLAAPATSGWELSMDRIGFWTVVAVVLIVVAYGPFFATYLPPDFISPGFTAF